MEEYRHFFSDTASLGAQLDCLAELHGRERIEGWKKLAAHGDWRTLVARLLEEHYDPAYRRSAARNFPRLAQAEVLRVHSATPAEFARLARGIASRQREATQVEAA
jgi:tRNA 2-selenouridine synthase